MSPEKRRRWLFIALAVYWPTLAVATHWPRLQIPGASDPDAEIWQRFGTDHALHVVCFALLAGLLIAVLPKRPRLIGGVVAAAYGVVDEATQPLFHRVGAVDDAAFNLVGVALAVLVATLWPGIRKPSAEPPPDPGSDRS